jgi:sugar phosphate isomerase/epimerase
MDRMPLGMSTSWNASRHRDGKALVREILELGFDHLEVEYRLRHEAVSGLREAVAAGRVRVLSVHNFSPLEPGEEPANLGGDKADLSSLDEVERRRAVRLTRRTMDFARSLGAKAVVLHTGQVGSDRAYFRELAETAKQRGVDSPEAARIRTETARIRREARGPYLEAVVKSLKDLAGPAAEAGLRICMENRYYHHQIPLPEEVPALLDRVSHPAVGYWHDTGHAHVQEVLGFQSHAEALDMVGPLVVGMHVHDSVYIRDHQPPGTGEVDFDAVFSRVPDSAIRIMELAPTVPRDHIDPDRMPLSLRTGTP